MTNEEILARFEAAVIQGYEKWKVLRLILVQRDDPKMPVTRFTGSRYRKSITLYGALTTAKSFLKSPRQKARYVASDPDQVWTDPSTTLEAYVLQYQSLFTAPELAEARRRLEIMQAHVYDMEAKIDRTQPKWVDLYTR
jgi:hypothetical protein